PVTTNIVPVVGNPVVEATLIVPVGKLTPLDPAAMVVACESTALFEPAATVVLSGAVVVVLGPTKKVPLVGNPVVETTLIVPFGKATLFEPAAIVVALPCCRDEI